MQNFSDLAQGKHF